MVCAHSQVSYQSSNSSLIKHPKSVQAVASDLHLTNKQRNTTNVTATYTSTSQDLSGKRDCTVLLSGLSTHKIIHLETQNVWFRT